MEIVKLALSFATPVIILILGIWAKNLAIDYEKRASLNGKIIEKRVHVYEKIGEDLNDIFVFLLQVGDWKKFSPAQVVAKKRNIDRLMYVNRPYWSDAAFSAYISFMNSAFETFTGAGEDAKIRTETGKFEILPNWNDDWRKSFSKNPSDKKILKDNYALLMENLSNDFGFYQKR